MLGSGALGRPRGMVWGGRREEGSGRGTRVCLWRTHFDIWQNEYNIVKFKNKVKFKKKKKNKINYLLSEKKWPVNILFGCAEDVTDIDYKSYSNPLPNSLHYNRYPYKKIGISLVAQQQRIHLPMQETRETWV